MAVSRKSEQLIGTFVHFNTLESEQMAGILQMTLSKAFFDTIIYLEDDGYSRRLPLFVWSEITIHVLVSGMVYNLY